MGVPSPKAGRARRLLVAVAAGALVSGLPPPARAINNTPPPVLEVSQSCLVSNQVNQLILWGANLWGDHQITDRNNDLAPTPVHVDPKGNGTFAVTVSLTPNHDPPTGPRADDTFYVDQDPIYVLVFKADRQVRVDTGTPGCPTNTPPPGPCVPPGAVQLRTIGLYAPDNSPAGGYPDGADWYLDYPGIGNKPVPFAHSVVGGTPGRDPGRATTVLPAALATSGGHQVTVLAHSPLLVTTDGGTTPDRDVYVTFTVNVCPPPPTTPPPTVTTTSTSTPTTAPAKNPAPATTTSTSTTNPAAPARPAPLQTLTVSPAVGSNGIATMVHGSGFTPGAPVTLEWLPGIGTAAGTVGSDGTFNVGMLVLFHDQVGPRQVHARGFPATVAAAFLVETGTAVPSHGGSALVIRH